MKIVNGSIGRLICIIAFLLLFQVIVAFAEETSNLITIGKTEVINSMVLREDRQIFINLPNGYESSNQAYPVIYLLDGESKFLFSTGVVSFLAGNNRVPEMIIIGIPNTNRDRDLTPNFEKSSGADAFLTFIREELIPFVDKHYRTEPYRILYGHSLAGMFAVYTMVKQPDLFNSYIAVSPALQSLDGYVVETADKKFTNNPPQNKSLFMSLGNEPTYVDAIGRFTKILDTTALKDFSWKYTTYDNENHGTVPLKSLYDGLEFLFNDLAITEEIAAKGIDAIKSYYAKLTDRYGFEVKPDEGVLNILGYQYLQAKNFDPALAFFQYSVELYPNSANVYDSLGEAYETVGKLDLALENYSKAVNLGQTGKHPFLNVFEENMNRVKKQVNKK